MQKSENLLIKSNLSCVLDEINIKDWQIDFSFQDIDPIPTENLIITRDELKRL